MQLLQHKQKMLKLQFIFTTIIFWTGYWVPEVLRSTQDPEETISLRWGLPKRAGRYFRGSNVQVLHLDWAEENIGCKSSKSTMVVHRIIHFNLECGLSVMTLYKWKPANRHMEIRCILFLFIKVKRMINCLYIRWIKVHNVYNFSYIARVWGLLPPNTRSDKICALRSITLQPFLVFNFYTHAVKDTNFHTSLEDVIGLINF